MSGRYQTGMSLVTVPWGIFVAAFLYYTLLAMIALGGVSPSLAVVGTAYLAPLLGYLVVVAFRLAGAAALGWIAKPAGHLAHLRLH